MAKEDEVLGRKIDPGIVGKWLDDKWKESPECPICKRNDWSISPYLYTIRLLEEEGMFWTQNVGPIVVHVRCNFCGYTLLFNAETIGVVELEEVDKELEKRLFPSEGGKTDE